MRQAVALRIPRFPADDQIATNSRFDARCAAEGLESASQLPAAFAAGAGVVGALVP
jgi:hypothetical protein